MKATKILTVLTLILLVCSLVACNDAGKDKTNDGDRKKEIASLMAMEPKSMEEATKLHQDLMAQETAILSDNNALWEKVFLSANKGSSMIGNGSNYGDFLLSTIEGAKDQFKADDPGAEVSGVREKAVRRRGERAGGERKARREGRSDAVPHV